MNTVLLHLTKSNTTAAPSTYILYDEALTVDLKQDCSISDFYIQLDITSQAIPL